MPTPDAPSLVRNRADLPRRGKLPADPTVVHVVESGAVHDDQSVGRRALFSWPVAFDEREAVREWRVYVRAASSPRFELLAITEEPSVFPCCSFPVGVLHEVAVVAIGLDGPNHRPPEDSSSRTLFTLHGQEPVPPAPTDVAVRVVDDEVLVTWSVPSYPAPVQYEVRAGGENFDGSTVVFQGRESFVQLPMLFPPSAQFDVLVAAKTATGLAGAPGVGSATLTAPNDLEVVVALDEENWSTGALGNLTTLGTDLVVIDGETVGVYTSSPVDTGAIDTYTLAMLVQARIENVGLTWGMAWFRWDSAEAGRRRWDGGTQEWFPTGEFSRPSSPSWDELTENWDDYAWLTWDALGDDRPTEDPSTLTWDECDFTWDSDFAASWTWDGPVSSAGTGWLLEVQFSNGGAYSAWEPYRQQTRSFRYLRWRLTLTQPAPALRVVAESIDIAVMQLRTKGQRWVEVEPTGVLNGFNDVFSLPSEPNPVESLQLFVDGVLVRPSTYDVTSTLVTFDAAPTGTWMLARYQR